MKAIQPVCSRACYSNNGALPIFGLENDCPLMRVIGSSCFLLPELSLHDKSM